MKIEKLEIRGFGKLSNVILPLDKGFNIIFGNNEAGKSTVQWFIKAMFFGLKGGKAAKDGTLPPLKRYRPWNEGDYTGFMEYRLDNGQLYRIGRNFATNSVRVFDSLFNDITNTFDASKERGIHFAERHLGIDETSFDKTVFVRQMEAKIGEEGSRELYNRMMNISETGFEDISFRKAQEALKEALKNYVGTDKTSTRPLDKVVGRLSELRTKKEELLQKKNSIFGIESELNNTVTLQNNLEGKKSFLEKIKKIIEVRKEIEKNKGIRAHAEEILRSINSDEEELRIILERSEDFSKTKAEFTRFSAYDNDDIDMLDVWYQKLLNSMDNSRKLGTEIGNKEKELEENRRSLRPILSFSELGDGIESHVIEINKDLEYLKRDYEKSNLEILNEKIKTTESKVKQYKSVSIISAVMAIILFAAGFAEVHVSFIISAAALAIAVISLILRGKVSRELTRLLDEKRMSFININSVIEEINKKKKTLVSIYEKVGAAGIEDFLRLKAEYDAKSKLIAALNSDINRLESELAINDREVSRLKNDILSKLIEADIVDNCEGEFEEEHIKAFKYGVRRYKGIEPSINYTAQKLEDINRNLARHYKNAASLCEEAFESKECLQKKINEINESLLKLETDMKAEIKELSCYSYDSLFVRILPEIACSNDKTDLLSLKSDWSREYLLVEEEYGKVCEELKNVLLNIREYETLIKSVSGDESELQSIAAEIEELEARKSQLEDINLSLKTALDVLTEASTEIQKDFVPLLNCKMADTVKRITGGRYRDLRADSSFVLKAIAPETGDVVSVSALSGGTVDQMYLALRVAMSDMVVQAGERLPFIMDEIFAQYDDTRTRETLAFLKGLSEQRQIILFTCKSREVEIVRQIFGNSLNLVEL
ncbi:MAG: AAA family ATPase [Clostridia bacterium]|nr:AAA family ATPase [Clostridia bacterium]